MATHLRANVCLIGLTLLACAVAYPLAVLAFAQAAFAASANGSLIDGPNGQPVGSALIAQQFQGDAYFHARPSAADYNAAASSGSNWGAGNPKLRDRVRAQLAKEYLSATDVPADLVTASGSGLDPHISLRGAKRQLDRVTARRGGRTAEVEAVLTELAFAPPGGEPLVNVLLVNRELDRRVPATGR